MIAPLRAPEAEPSEGRAALRQARRLVATTLFPERTASVGPRMSAWQAWLFLAWIVFTTGAFGLAMLGWLE